MDAIQIELAKLRKDGNLKQSIDDVNKIIEQLERARETIVAGMWHLEKPKSLLTVHRPQFRLHYSGKAAKSCEAWLR